jgi:threonine dehydratase
MNKLEDLKDEHILISLQERPLQTLFIKTQDDSIRGLRQSTDDTALIGYNALAEELLEIKDLRAVFIGTSSGTTAQALAEYFDKHGKKIEVHVVQTSSCHPIAGVFVDSEATEEKSIADAIVDHVAARKEALTSLLEKTNGNGWIARNEQISIAQELTEKHAKIVISPNSALSVAGVMEASYTGKTWDGSVVCLICGE